MASHSNPRRELQEIASKTDPRLKELWEIMHEVKESRDRRREVSGIRPYLNLERLSIYKISPLNLSLCDEWEALEPLDLKTRRNNVPTVLFKMSPNQLALITMDLRTVMKSEVN